MIIPFWTRGKKGIITGIVLLLIGILILSFILISGGNESVQTVDNPDNAQTGDIYDLGDCLIIDEYASTEYKNKSTDHFFLAATSDKENKLVVFSLMVNEDDDVYPDFQQYISDRNAQIGSLTLPVVARASELNISGFEETKGFYDQALPHYAELLEFTPAKEVKFTYLFATPDGIDDYNSSQKTASVFIGIFGAAEIALGLMLIIKNVRKKVFR